MVFGESAGSWISLSGLLYCQFFGVTGWVRNNWDDRVEMEAQGSRELLAQMVEMLGRQRFIEIEGIEERVIPVEVESGFYSR